MIPVVNPYIISGGGPPPPEPSYWNGTDDTVEELFGTQWGITGAYFDNDGGGGICDVVDGELIISGQTGWPLFCFDGVDAGNTFWISGPDFFEGYITPENGTATLMSGTDLDGYKVIKIVTTGTMTYFNVDPSNSIFRLWDTDPR